MLCKRFCHEQSIDLSIVLCMMREIMKIRAVRETFCDHHLLDAQLVLHSLVVCYDIHMTLAHINSHWAGTIAYRMTYDEMLARRSLIHARISWFCQDARSGPISCSL